MLDFYEYVLKLPNYTQLSFYTQILSEDHRNELLLNLAFWEGPVKSL